MNTSKIKIEAIPAFNDNYIWLLTNSDTSKAIVVDPGDESPVLQYLEKHKLALGAILITHRHYDHVDGIPGLLKHNSDLDIFGPASETIRGVRHRLARGDYVDLSSYGFEGKTLQVLDVPGHTAGHIAYYSESGNICDAPVLFCGDTLFAAGCGRLFDGTAKQLYKSLSLLATLPKETMVYCTHEYTLNNLSFANLVEPGNKAVVQRQQQVRLLREKGQPSLPTTIGEELKTNPFLRVGYLAVRQAVEHYAGKVIDTDEEVFEALRKWKDNF